MAFKCKIGFHSWNGCKCNECGKTRDDQHNWDGCKCTECGKIRNEQHVSNKDCEICSKCGTIRDNPHDYSKDCENCSNCRKSRDNKHDWSKDCHCCYLCGKRGEEAHYWVDGKCTKCDKLRKCTHNLDELLKINESGQFHGKMICYDCDEKPKIEEWLKNLKISDYVSPCSDNSDIKVLKKIKTTLNGALSYCNEGMGYEMFKDFPFTLWIDFKFSDEGTTRTCISWYAIRTGDDEYIIWKESKRVGIQYIP